jgi:hypothetical protein
MAAEYGKEIRNQVLGRIAPDVIAAKAVLRDRLAGRIALGAAQAMTVRKRRKFAPALSINVVGFGIGEKNTGESLTGELCVKVFVAKKFPRSRVSRSDLIPKSLDSVPTDVEEIGYPKRFAPANRERHRPVLGGVSIGLGREAVSFDFAGTFGLVVRDRENAAKRYALSNNHVLADENRVSVGAKVLQPGTLDGGRASDGVGGLSAFIPLKFDNRRNYSDAAIAALNGSVTLSILGIGTPAGAARPLLNMLVRKSGRTTGVTEGIIRAVNSDIFDIEYEQGPVRVDDCLVIRASVASTSFSKPGDSGSAIVNAQGKVVGLLFAGSDVVTFATPISRVLRRFKVRVAR